MLQYLIKWKGYPKSDNTWEDANQIHAPDLIKLYHKGNPLQKIKGRHLLLQSPHLPTWQSSTSLSLRSLQTPSSLQTTKIPLNTLNPSFIHTHSQPTSLTSSTLVGSETTPLGATPSNTPISARKRTATTTLRLAWNHPLSYLVHPARCRPTTRTSSHKFVLTPHLNHQSSIYVPSIDHKDLAHIPDPSSCRQMGLSICQTYRPLNLQHPFQSLAQRLRLHRQCRLGRFSQPSPRMTTSMRCSFALSRTDSLPRSPIARPTLQCSSTASPSRSKAFRIAFSNMKKPSSEPQRAMSSITDVFPTSASHVATGSPARLSGSSSMTTEQCRALQTRMALNQPRTSPTYMPNLTTNTLKRETRNPHSPYRRGSASSRWAHQLISLYSITPLLTLMIGRSPARSTDTATSTANLPIPASSSNKCRLTSMPSARLGPLAKLGSSSHEHRSRSKNSRMYRASPRPRGADGSVRLVDVVVQSSGGVMLPALRSPARPDLPCLM